MRNINLDKVKQRLLKVNPEIDNIFERCRLGARPLPKPPVKPPVDPPVGKAYGYLPYGFGEIDLTISYEPTYGEFTRPASFTTGVNKADVSCDGIPTVHTLEYYADPESYCHIGEVNLSLTHDGVSKYFHFNNGSESALEMEADIDWPSYEEFPFHEKRNVTCMYSGFEYKFSRVDTYVDGLSIHRTGDVWDDSENMYVNINNGDIDTGCVPFNVTADIYSSKLHTEWFNSVEYTSNEAKLGSSNIAVWEDTDTVNSDFTTIYNNSGYGFGKLYGSTYGTIDVYHSDSKDTAGTSIEMYDGIKIESSWGTYSHIEDGDKIVLEDMAAIAGGNVPTSKKCEITTNSGQVISVDSSDIEVAWPNVIIKPKAQAEAITEVVVTIEYSHIKELKIGKRP